MPNTKSSAQNILIATSLLVALLAQPCAAQSTASARPFLERPVVAEHIHVDSPSQFRRWGSGDIPLGDYDNDSYERTRLGSVLIAPGIWAYVDAVWDKIDTPSFFELIDATSRILLTRVAVKQLPDAEWYFPGNGIFYVNQTHLGLCGPRHTRKFVLRGRTAPETLQPLAYVGADTETQENTPLYDLPAGGSIVATLAAGSKVTVLGVLAESIEPREAPLLVKTPLGLTGWHHRLRRPGDGSLSIYQCN